VPCRFYVQVNIDGLKSLVVPPAIVPVLVRKLRISKQAVAKVRLWTAAFCEYKVHMQMFEDQLVFFKGWKWIIKKAGLNVSGTIAFECGNEGLKIELFKKTTSTQASVAAMALDR
jgi:hypothetical protein